MERSGDNFIYLDQTYRYLWLLTINPQIGLGWVQWRHYGWYYPVCNRVGVTHDREAVSIETAKQASTMVRSTVGLQLGEVGGTVSQRGGGGGQDYHI